MTHVKYDGLKQEIRKHHGKVIIVDFWASTCPPCIASFPKFVKMHEKYAEKGLVIITVSKDPVDEDGDFVKSANKILTQNKLPFVNLLLDEPSEVWEKQFDYKSLPFYYVFDRQGKWARYRAADYVKGVPYDEMEKVVMQMLAEK